MVRHVKRIKRRSGTISRRVAGIPHYSSDFQTTIDQTSLKKYNVPALFPVGLLLDEHAKEMLALMANS
jgi:hypothetical protein